MVGIAAEAKPNIVFILTDDMEVEIARHMPHVQNLLVKQGATFTRAYHNHPLCCPSRATMLTGKYVQNTGVNSNSHSLFFNAENKQLPSRTFAVWLKNAGYRTGNFGKYLNGYPSPNGVSYIPPGWTTWAVHAGDTSTDNKGHQYNYYLSYNGVRETHGTASTDYGTDVYAGKARTFLDQALASGQPFLLHFAPHAPHVPAEPAPRHKSLFGSLTSPRPPNWDEADVSDKPSYIRSKGRFNSEFIAKLDDRYRQRARSLQAVDEAFKSFYDRIAAKGQVGNTYFVIISDNGWTHGQHRLGGSKGPPYQESIQALLAVRGPGIPANSRVERLVGNVDVAATIAQWAGATIPSDVNMDGRSFAAVATGATPTTWRQVFPLNWKYSSSAGPAPTWVGVVTERYKYVEYATSPVETELYDLQDDPYELVNRTNSSAYSTIKSKLRTRMNELKTCKGADCRTKENAPL